MLLTREQSGYYRDYQNAPAHVARSLAQGFSYQGEPSPHREGRRRGEPSAHLPRADFVNFLQNHDQIGNRPMGERLAVLAPPEALAAALTLLLLQPGPPLLFMGEEWGATRAVPVFLRFCRRAGRGGAPRAAARIRAGLCRARRRNPRSAGAETRDAAVLDWNALNDPEHARQLALTRALLTVRQQRIVPLLAAMTGPGVVAFDHGILHARWNSGAGGLAAARQFIGGGAAASEGFDLGRSDLGRRASRNTAALVGLCRDRSGAMIPAVPRATYRLQLTKDFGFDDAAALAPYLKELGISHLYASPFLKARPGSTHGYDIVDHDRLNPELGGEEGFARLSAALKQNELGLILDFVPNHMGVGHADNAWWLDVLEWGQKSPYAMAFDIDWEALPYRRHPGVLIPILGRPYGEALQSGEIELALRRRRTAALPSGTSTTSCRSIRSATTRCCAPS